ncbi:MAG TPA: M15 family metallopeptidase, partial [Chitinophagaceae bacterium]|nr:M15 family metallopeptidase [Chitinophagaceae bacterium]
LLAACASQRPGAGKYGVETVNSLSDYRKLVRADSSKELVNVKRFVPSIILDIKYATTDNFMKEAMYKSAEAFLSRPAVRSLKRVEEELNKMGYGLKIYDAYRPYSVTVAFYEKVKDTAYVASAYRGSRHNRGCAVDLTLIDLGTGKELLMPTAFDDFSPKAASDYHDLTPEAIRNRELLQRVMTSNGFAIYANEWWHFDYSGWRNHPLMDISFRQLLR